MIALHLNKVQLIQSDYSAETLNQYNKAFAALLALRKRVIKPEDRQYILKICMAFRRNPDIITATPDKLEDIAISIADVPVERVSYTRMGKQYWRKKTSNIWKDVVEALGYENLRADFYPLYFSRLGIKSCVYCNAQYTLSIEKKRGAKVLAKYDVDHYRSKSKFPWQCICLFNLYPSCAPCNRAKSSKSLDFSLYSDKTNQVSTSGFRFRLEAYTVTNFLTSKSHQNIRFVFEDSSGTDHYDKMFSITEIYETQLDLAAELIIASQMYDKTNRESLKRNFSKLNLSKDIFNRVILGSHTSEREIHLRPMSKFKQDIAKELGIL